MCIDYVCIIIFIILVGFRWSYFVFFFFAQGAFLYSSSAQQMIVPFLTPSFAISCRKHVLYWFLCSTAIGYRAFIREGLVLLYSYIGARAMRGFAWSSACKYQKAELFLCNFYRVVSETKKTFNYFSLSLNNWIEKQLNHNI